MGAHRYSGIEAVTASTACHWRPANSLGMSLGIEKLPSAAVFAEPVMVSSRNAIEADRVAVTVTSPHGANPKSGGMSPSMMGASAAASWTLKTRPVSRIGHHSQRDTDSVAEQHGSHR